MDDGPEINPSVVFLFDLLKWIRQGRIRVPAFQRSYVWSRQHMLDLFDSVHRRYPIGTLLFWKSSIESAAPHTHFGPFDLSKTQPMDTLLLLDGQQRLTTLAGVLLRGSGLPIIEMDDDPTRWNIYFDASGKEDGVFMYLSSDHQPEVWQVPLHQLIETATLFKSIGNLYQQDGETLADIKKEVLIERLQGVARALQSYKIPIVEFVTDDLNLAVESFTRLNRKGVHIGADEMFSALTYQAGTEGKRFHIAREIDETLGAIKQVGFGEVDRVLILRAFLVSAGLDPYRTNWNRLSKGTQEEVARVLPDAMRRAREGLLGGIKFLREEHIYHARMLPYGLQLVGLSAWFGENPDPSPEAIRLLRRWLWLTGFSSWFGQGNPSRYAAVLAELHDCAKAVREHGAVVPTELKHLPWSTPAEPFPARYDLRSARVRTLLCLLARNGVQRPDGELKNASAIAGDFALNGPEAMRTIWARSSSSTASSPANRMFDVFGAERGQVRTLLKIKSLDNNRAFLESHMLPHPITEAMKDSDAMQRVLDTRLENMINHERDFMNELEIVLPTSMEPKAISIDQEDVAPLSVLTDDESSME
ncbi:DUF262 domain-containing protein [Myxococcota bacterium]|nr:DUF262 domain-containing protein [Myxococcota bacterium]MBU1896548.1 DUF262 domain-containing protein [Myxococcota bacterium]